MEDERGSGSSWEIPRSESKVILGEKRGISVVGEKSELGLKRRKMRDLQSIFRSSEESDTHSPKSSNSKETNSLYQGIPEVNTENAFNSQEVATSGASQMEFDHSSRPIDLNAKVCVANYLNNDENSACVEDDLSHKKAKSSGFVLNAEAVSTAPTIDPFYPYKNYENLKSKDISECGSSIDPLEERDPMRIWKEMKQNGFLSSSHGGIPVPKPRGRKSKNDGIKKKIELAKREQADRFAKVAAPSGLLNGLNPGIINHVRNSKQVHSIIEALVRSEKHANSLSGSKHSNQLKGANKESKCRKKDNDSLIDAGKNRFEFCHEEATNTLSARGKAIEGTKSLNRSSYLMLEGIGEHDDSCTVERTAFCNSDPESEYDIFSLKPSPSTNLTEENTSILYNEASANLTKVSSLSVEAANVALQWLDLLAEDIKGRLAALRRSKKRVLAVIQSELPFLFSKEFSANQENDPYSAKVSTNSCSDNATADMHRAKWNTLFDQMDKSLSEEENQLEKWLNQVKEMRLHCEQGLSQHNGTQGLHHIGASDIDHRLDEGDSSEKELAIQAAAASIYSTCNFLMSM